MLPFHIEISSGFQVATYPAGATFGPRHLRDFELVWIIEGDVRYRVDADWFAAPPGSVVLCRPGTQDFFQWDPRRRTRHGWFHFYLQGTPPDEWGPISSWATVRPSQHEADVLPALFRQLVRAHTATPTDTTANLLALALLAAFVTGDGKQQVPIEDTPYPEAVTRAMAFIAARLEEQPADALPLEEVARAAYVTPEHLCRLFKQHTDHSPAETVRLLRLDRAALLLARTNFSVGEVAALCGFSSQFHFARRFKEAFGQTPTDLRRAIAAGSGAVPVTRLVRT